jgi:hypothetical protein
MVLMPNWLVVVIVAVVAVLAWVVLIQPNI